MALYIEISILRAQYRNAEEIIASLYPYSIRDPIAGVPCNGMVLLEKIIH
jgi:hypothetical protein